MVILVFRTLSTKTQTIPAEDEQTLEDLIPLLAESFKFDTTDPSRYSFFYAAKQQPITTKIKDLNFDSNKFIIVKVQNPKPAPASSQNQSAVPAQPAPAVPAPSAPAQPAQPAPQNPQVQPPPRASVNPNMSDEEFIRTSINNLPSKEKFDDNLSEVMAFSGADHDTAVRALIQTSNSVSMATNLILDNKVPSIAQMRNMSAQQNLQRANNNAFRRGPSIRQRFREIAKRIPGMDEDNLIQSSIVPPTFGHNIQSPNTYNLYNEFEIKQKFTSERNMEEAYTLALRDPHFLQMIQNHPSIANEADKSRALSRLGFIQLENGDLSSSVELPTSEIFGAMPEDFTDDDVENVLQIHLRGFNIQDILSYYEACNRDLPATLNLLSGELNQLRRQRN